MSVDVLSSGKSVFSLFYVCLFDQLFSLHVFFADTEDCTVGRKGEVEIPNTIVFSCEQLNIIFNRTLSPV